MAARRQQIGDGLAGLAGARSDILELAPGARSKFVALGGVLLSTGALAVLSMTFAVHMALGVWWPFAMLIGLGWGFVVVNLDRMLLVGMAHDSSLKRNLVLAVPRVGLALVLGVVIATPLTLQVFHREIDTQIVALQAEKSDAYQRSLDADARFVGLPELREQVAIEQEIVASGGLTDPALAVVHGDVTARQAAYDQAMTTQQRARGARPVRARRHVRHRRRRHRDGVPAGPDGGRRAALRRHGHAGGPRDGAGRGVRCGDPQRAAGARRPRDPPGRARPG